MPGVNKSRARREEEEEGRRVGDPGPSIRTFVSEVLNAPETRGSWGRANVDTRTRHYATMFTIHPSPHGMGH